MSNIFPVWLLVRQTVSGLLSEEMSSRFCFQLQNRTIRTDASEMQADRNAALVSLGVHHLIEVPPPGQSGALWGHHNDERFRLADVRVQFLFIIFPHQIKAHNAIKIASTTVVASNENVRGASFPPHDFENVNMGGEAVQREEVAISIIQLLGQQRQAGNLDSHNIRIESRHHVGDNVIAVHIEVNEHVFGGKAWVQRAVVEVVVTVRLRRRADANKRAGVLAAVVEVLLNLFMLFFRVGFLPVFFKAFLYFNICSVGYAAFASVCTGGA